MAIDFACTACGGRVTAPAALEGQKARCPQCGAVVEVPVPVLEAEPVPSEAFTAAPALLPDPPPPAVGSAETRRPCPMCGELIMAIAVKCRFCGEFLDPTLRRDRDPTLMEAYRKQSRTLGMLWIVLGVIALLFLPGRNHFTLPTVAVVWLALGVGAYNCRLWVVYLGLVLSYIGLVGSLLALVGGLAANTWLALAIPAAGLLLMLLSIAQARTVTGMAGRLNLWETTAPG